MRTEGAPSVELEATATAPGSRKPQSTAWPYQAANWRRGSGSTSCSRNGRANSGTPTIIGVAARLRRLAPARSIEGDEPARRPDRLSLTVVASSSNRRDFLRELMGQVSRSAGELVGQALPDRLPAFGDEAPAPDIAPEVRAVAPAAPSRC